MAQPPYEQLLDIIAQEDHRAAQLEAHVVQLQTRVAKLEQLVDKTTRAGKRQVAPFSKGTPKENPTKPGRKSGKKYGPKARHPLPGQEPDEIIDVPLPV